MRIAEVLLPLPFDHGFSYFIPEDLAVEIGDVVLVSFKKATLYGVVTKIENQTSLDSKKIKTLLGKETNFKLTTELIDFIKWVAAYNLAPSGLVLKLSITTLNNSRAPHKIFYSLIPTPSTSIRLTPKRQKLLDFMSQNVQAVTLQDLKKHGDFSESALAFLVRGGLIEKKSCPINLQSATETEFLSSNYNFKLKVLNKIQKQAASFLATKIAEKKHSVTLLDGVTGSGKTEIYFYAIAKVLKESISKKGKGQILILLPEIVLTTQLVQRFTNQFGFSPAIWHSKISSTEKRRLFYDLASGRARVIIGARSALFLPFYDLALIIVDEEHDSSFKQEDQINYHGRDMAVVRGKFENIPVILSSATPSLESFLNARNGKYHHLTIGQKWQENQINHIGLIDMRKEKPSKNCHLAPSLRLKLQENFAAQKQSLLFLNRRGYAPLTLCSTCGHKIECVSCSSYLTYHQKARKLMCHYCGYYSALPDQCPSCQATKTLISCGAGAEKIGEEVRELLPKARLALMTSDNITSISKAEIIIKQIIDNNIDIIIGTQIIAKGHHFPALALVGIVDGDGSFYNAGLRTSEKSYQLLTQLIGRAGREKYQGQVLLQTYQPENLVFQNLIKGSRDQFLENEIKNRQMLDMPPFSKMAALIFSAASEEKSLKAAKLIASELAGLEHSRIFGPAPLPIIKLKDRYYYRLIIKTSRKINLQKLISRVIQKNPLPKGIILKIDIDPL